MLHGSTRPGVAGSELSRLLARLAEVPPAETRVPFAERLGHWLGWTDAIALSTALSSANGSASSSAPAAGRPRPGDHEADFQRVRSALLAAIAASPHDTDASPTDFAPHRRHCIAMQQAMQDAVGTLRQRLRGALARRSPELATLAEIDAAMDRALAPHERGLLGLVPQRLQAHFERLHRAVANDADTFAWLDAFRQDMNLVLQAELAHRLLPAQGLLDTLRTETTT